MNATEQVDALLAAFDRCDPYNFEQREQLVVDVYEILGLELPPKQQEYP